MDGNKLFSKYHIWVKIEGNSAYLGITNFAQEKMKSVMFLNLEDEGTEILQGNKFGDIESIKTVSDLISPVSGTIEKVNEELVDDPDLINENAEECWLVKLKNISLSSELMNEEAYLESKEDL
ncbi:glycine cleavage system protein H [uncultured Clostridium sp.]|uniref:glycine cleavage system protein H n=1 Tax=uncultured Clostridium sp. TaxID=59620 RepID=UPI002595A3CA|nr:glycine cleavage system protein H [uncultured Clostridium sp.]